MNVDSNPAPKKIKWRLNLFDIVFIVLLLVAAGFILNYLNSLDSRSSILPSGTQETVIYTIEFRAMMPEAAVLIQPGDELVDRIEKRSVGTVVSVELVPATVLQKSSITGERIITEIPNRFDAIVVIEALANVTESQISVDGFTIRYGVSIFFSGPQYGSSGFIVNIERADRA
jgi:hypothetical protein